MVYEEARLVWESVRRRLGTAVFAEQVAHEALIIARQDRERLEQAAQPEPAAPASGAAAHRSSRA